MFSDVGGYLPDIFPEVGIGYGKPVFVRIFGQFFVIEFSHSFFKFLFPHVTDPFVEKKPKNIMFVVGGIDFTPENIRCTPKMGFQILLCKFFQIELLNAVGNFLIFDLYVVGNISGGEGL